MALLQYGARGDSVKNLQTQLNNLGFNVGSADGIYGKNTQAGVRAFQQKYGLTVDGIAGNQTFGQLSKLKGNGTATNIPEGKAIMLGGSSSKPKTTPVTQIQNQYQNTKNNLANQAKTITNNYNNQAKQNQQQVTNRQNQYNNSDAKTNYDRMQNATIDDIAKKYGFDFSREYANRQAEAEAQAKRNAYNNSLRLNETQNQETMQQIENNVRESNTALDHNYFQQMLAQQQSQANSGLNGGIAADQNLRLAMNKQAQLADVYKDANLGRMQESNRFNNESTRLSEALALVEQQKTAQAQELYQELLMRGYDILGQDRNWARQVDRDARGDMEFDVGQLEKALDRLRNNYEFDLGWNRQSERDARGDMEFDVGRIDDLDQQTWQRQFEQAKFDWQKKMQEAELALARQSAARARATTGSPSGNPSLTSLGGANPDNLYEQFLKEGGADNQGLSMLQLRRSVPTRQSTQSDRNARGFNTGTKAYRSAVY